jgi:hypothetical protein
MLKPVYYYDRKPQCSYFVARISSETRTGRRWNVGLWVGFGRTLQFRLSRRMLKIIQRFGKHCSCHRHGEFVMAGRFRQPWPVQGRQHFTAFCAVCPRRPKLRTELRILRTPFGWLVLRVRWKTSVTQKGGSLCMNWAGASFSAVTLHRGLTEHWCAGNFNVDLRKRISWEQVLQIWHFLQAICAICCKCLS